MWIRSQDKSSIVNVDNLYISVGNYICYYVEKGKEAPDTHYRPSGELGRYESKERALEVLNAIEDTLIARRMIDIYGNNSALFKGISGDNIKKTFNTTAVYEMPEK